MSNICGRKICCTECPTNADIICECQVQYNENYETLPNDFKRTECEGGGVEQQVEKIKKKAQKTIGTGCPIG